MCFESNYTSETIVHNRNFGFWKPQSVFKRCHYKVVDTNILDAQYTVAAIIWDMVAAAMWYFGLLDQVRDRGEEFKVLFREGCFILSSSKSRWSQESYKFFAFELQPTAFLLLLFVWLVCFVFVFSVPLPPYPAQAYLVLLVLPPRPPKRTRVRGSVC